MSKKFQNNCRNASEEDLELSAISPAILEHLWFPDVEIRYFHRHQKIKKQTGQITRQSKQCGFSIYTFDNLKSKSMVKLVRAEKMVLSGLIFARKIARMILIQNI